MRFPWFSKREETPPVLPGFADRLADLESQVKRIARDQDDLDERFAAFKGRVTKREGLAAQSAPELGPREAGIDGGSDILAIRRGGRMFPGGGR